jgi:hypothetical protein
MAARWTGAKARSVPVVPCESDIAIAVAPSQRLNFDRTVIGVQGQQRPAAI